MTQQIAFIGGGNMASSLIGGLLADGYPATHIHVVEPDATKREALNRDFNIYTHADAVDAARLVDVVVLAVKPQILQAVCKNVAADVQENSPLVISVAAGLLCKDIERWLGGEISLVRCMPNTPALLRCGATGLYANSHVNEAQKSIAENILKTAGITIWVDQEEKLDVVTAVSGSGPAYYFLFMEAMQAAAVEMGLTAEQAALLTQQTALGAARMATEGDVDVATLRANVTSKGGTTEQAINTFETHKLRSIVKAAMVAADSRAKELATILGKDDAE